jgi:hypothetical protein
MGRGAHLLLQFAALFSISELLRTLRLLRIDETIRQEDRENLVTASCAEVLTENAEIIDVNS